METPTNKEILQTANAAVAKGDNEAFLTHCTEDTLWTFVGERVLRGKEAVRQYMKEAYVEPPRFTLTNSIAEREYVTALGDITVKDNDGKEIESSYCDVWRFRDGKLAELTAFVIPKAEKE